MSRTKKIKSTVENATAPGEVLPSAHDETGHCRRCGSNATSLVIAQEAVGSDVMAVACRMCGRIVRYVDSRAAVNPTDRDALKFLMRERFGDEAITAIDAYLFRQGETKQKSVSARAC